jgi:hypothetical protein
VDHLGVLELLQRPPEARPVLVGDAKGVQRGGGARVPVQSADQLHQACRLEEGQTPVPVVVGERAERLGSQRDLGMERVTALGVEGHVRRCQ